MEATRARGCQATLEGMIREEVAPTTEEAIRVDSFLPLDNRTFHRTIQAALDLVECTLTILALLT